jgi:regulation of enolase protein 1 (concanavalin A-like superfamily)
LNSTKEPVQVGIYACSPQGEGYEAQFDFIKIEKM